MRVRLGIFLSTVANHHSSNYMYRYSLLFDKLSLHTGQRRLYYLNNHKYQSIHLFLHYQLVRLNYQSMTFLPI